MIRRIVILSLVLIILALPLSGCWGKQEVESLGFVFGIGIDSGSKPGTYLVTYQIGMPKKAGEAGGGVEDYTISVEGFSMRETTENIYNTIARQPFVGTLKIIVLGDSVAREGINSVLDFFHRYYEFRRTTYLVLAKGKAKDLLNIKLRTNKLVSLTLLDDIEKVDMASTFPKVRLGHYLTMLGNVSSAQVIPLAYGITPDQEGIKYESKDSEKPEEIRLSGMGVFEGDKLKAILTEEETKGFMWLHSEVKNRFLTAKLSNEQNNFFVSCRVTKTKTNSKLKEIDDKLGIHYEIKVVCDLDELSVEQKQRTPEEYLKVVKDTKAIDNLIMDECEAALKRNRELGLDFLGIGRKIEERKPQEWKKIKDQWQQLLPNFPVTVSVNLEWESGGSSFNPPTNPVGTGQ
ncbi:MAG: Ger(x)C family spore germination protein [Desulfitobacteriaceae bacterium]